MLYLLIYFNYWLIKRKQMSQDITNKKFTLTLPQLIGIVSLLSTVIGFYYYAKTTIQNLQQSVDISITSYKDVKAEVKLLREQMYEIAFLYNRNISNENEITHMIEERKIGTIKQRRKMTPKLLVRDTIDLSQLLRKRSVR